MRRHREWDEMILLYYERTVFGRTFYEGQDDNQRLLLHRFVYFTYSNYGADQYSYACGSADDAADIRGSSGRKRGFLAAAVYVLLGAVGAPVFAGFTGGIGIILGATGGFIVSFPLMAYLAGLGMEKMSPVYLWGSLIIGAFLNYACGTVWFMAFSGSALQTALMGCVVPFIPTSIVKIILDGTAGPLLRNVLSRAGLIDSRSAS